MDLVAIARAPICVYLAGDLEEVTRRYADSGGTSLCVATGYYTYALLTRSTLDGVQVLYAGRQAWSGETGAAGGELEMLAAIARQVQVPGGWQLHVAAQMPSGMGRALRGSAAVAALKVLAFRAGLDIEPQALAGLAADLEHDLLGTNTGLHVPHAAAHGGLCAISSAGGRVVVEPLQMDDGTKEALVTWLMVFGAPQRAVSAVQRVRESAFDDDEYLTEVRNLSWAVRFALEHGRLEALGYLLHRVWRQREAVLGVDPALTRRYEAAREAGALGGTATGVSGDAFLVLLCPPEQQPAVSAALSALGCARWLLRLDEGGVYAMEGEPWSRAARGYAPSEEEGDVSQDAGPASTEEPSGSLQARGAA
ncbi:MAG: hypothetical protein JXA09_03775 [Anaerolineae bacterium]|nr:hypothetical protein [Anaerolineae bacterium]